MQNGRNIFNSFSSQVGRWVYFPRSRTFDLLSWFHLKIENKPRYDSGPIDRVNIRFILYYLYTHSYMQNFLSLFLSLYLCVRFIASKRKVKAHFSARISANLDSFYWLYSSLFLIRLLLLIFSSRLANYFFLLHFFSESHINLRTSYITFESSQFTSSVNFDNWNEL